METRLRSHNDVTIIDVGGTLDIEHTQIFRQALIEKFDGRKIVFDMQKASFVGSTGLGAFFDGVRKLSQKSAWGIKVIGANSEFRRLFQNMEITNLEIFESEQLAVDSFQSPRV